MSFTVATVISLMALMRVAKPTWWRYRRMHMPGFQSRKYCENRPKTTPVDRAVTRACVLVTLSPAKCKTSPSTLQRSPVKRPNATESKTRTKDRRFGKSAGALVGERLTRTISSAINAR
jgi:hypothetical protein